MILTTLLALAALNGVQAQPQTRQANPGSTATSTATAESAEILRHILADALDDGFSTSKDGDQLSVRREGMPFRNIVTTLWASDQTVQHSRVFHLPEVGLFFSLDVALPVVKKKAAPTAGPGDRPTDDEWERARRELRGDPLEAGRWRVRMDAEESEIDSQAIEKTIDLVLRTCARHAGHVEGLAPQETLTIALRLSGKGHGWGGEAVPSLQSVFQRRGEGAKDGDGEGDNDGKENGFAYVLSDGGNVREQNLVIRVSLSDLAAASDGNVERLRQRALINRY